MKDDNDLLARSRNLGRVVVLVGGDSHEKEISLMSLDQVTAIMTSLEIAFDVVDIGTDRVFDLKTGGFSRALIIAHGKNGEDGCIQGLLDLMKIPYTGSGALAATQGFNKWLSKLVWQSVGLSVPRGRLVSTYGQCEDFFHQLDTRLVLKPMRGGSTMGVRTINDKSDLLDAYDEARQLDNYLVLEEFIDGHELTCGIYYDDALPVIRIDHPGTVYDYHEKYFGNRTKYYCPSEIPARLDYEFRSMTVSAARAIGCHFWGRVDAILREDKVYLLEMNIAPGLTPHSLYPMALRAANISLGEFLVNLLENCRVG
ncbi:D-alanine--D-alanine ligase [Candidatus Ichthyocystis hellenicum]|uniref:D-alanine--D-alanine ligase n=1 Tax=Candidatus Ichthyocystis hellenicum TaxID=1561003 RepID=UPI000B12A05A|nr:D-alanine--D-alanine ligase [Candidatus Ichthyocystis hellenicum]